MAEPGSTDFYREQALRLARLAALSTNDAVRGELQEMAAAFQRLAERASKAEDGEPKADLESA
jgi:hypothetical protein